MRSASRVRPPRVAVSDRLLRGFARLSCIATLGSPPSPFPAPSLPQVKKFAHKVMKTADVRVDVKLNKHIWSKGIRNVRPRRDPRVSGTRVASQNS